MPRMSNRATEVGESGWSFEAVEDTYDSLWWKQTKRTRLTQKYSFHPHPPIHYTNITLPITQPLFNNCSKQHLTSVRKSRRVIESGWTWSTLLPVGVPVTQPSKWMFISKLLTKTQCQLPYVRRALGMLSIIFLVLMALMATCHWRFFSFKGNDTWAIFCLVIIILGYMITPAVRQLLMIGPSSSLRLSWA